jgi:hypothetical protein
MTLTVYEGELARTPFAHLLVYAFDHRLTGALFLKEPLGTQHVVSFERGAPVKVRPGDGYALLGRLLVEAGAITEGTLEGALSVPALLGDALLVGGVIDNGTLESVAEAQFLKRMVRLFGLPPETTYRYIDGSDELSDWGGGNATTDPLALLWAGLREHARASTMMDGTLERLGRGALALHASAPLSRFVFDPPELDVAVTIRERARPLDELIACGVAPEEVVRRIVYALAITRSIDFGHGVMPVGLSDDADAPEESESSSRPSSTPVGRVRLRRIAQRAGAAAPDAPGSGEPPSDGARARKQGLGPEE